MSRLSAQAVVGEKLLKGLGVSATYLIDWSRVSLWDGASERYPGTWTQAAIKACVYRPAQRPDALIRPVGRFAQ